MVTILDFFKPEELKEKSDGNFQTICPACGLQGGRTEGFVLFPTTNTAYCHSSHKTFNMLEFAALKFELIKCIEGRDNKDDESPVNDEMIEELLENIKSEYGVDFLKNFKSRAGMDDSMEVQKIDTEEEETETELIVAKSKLNFDLFTKNSMSTEHLVLFNEMDENLGLDGENYASFKKCLWYYQHSLLQPCVSYKINIKTKIDNRTHMCIASSPSGGKTTTKNQIKRISDDVIEQTGLSHQEQLIGKMKTVGKGSNKTTEPVYGILYYKGVLNDESQDLINEKNDMYSKAQRIKRTAMDCYTDNTISKKLVDDSPENILQYDPTCNIIDFIHPVKLESSFFDTGSFRRYFMFNLTHDTILNISDITDFKLNDTYATHDYPDLINKHYNQNKAVVRFSQETLDIVSHFHKCLLIYLLNHNNQNAFRYGLLTRYSLRNLFCKNILILATSKNEITPSFETTINACKDTMLFVFKSIEFINDLGDMGISSDVWGGVSPELAQALEFLWRKKATSREDSEVSIRKFWTILGHLHGCRITQARSYFYKLKKDGFVNSKRASTNEYAKVWLTFIPKGITIDNENHEPLKFWDKFESKMENKKVTASPKNTLLAVTKSIFKGENYKKRVTDGTVGVMGCLLSICVNLKNKQNKIYIYNKGGGTPSVPTVAKKTTKGERIPIGLTKSNCQNTPKQTGSYSTQIPLKSTKSDRETQFYDADECKDIKPNHTKEDVSKWIKDNPDYKPEELYKQFGVGCFKFEVELKQDMKKDGKK